MTKAKNTNRNTAAGGCGDRGHGQTEAQQNSGTAAYSYGLSSPPTAVLTVLTKLQMRILPQVAPWQRPMPNTSWVGYWFAESWTTMNGDKGQMWRWFGEFLLVPPRSSFMLAILVTLLVIFPVVLLVVSSWPQPMPSIPPRWTPPAKATLRKSTPVRKDTY
ncbi:hypothetical protein V502_04765 [Pseudogymnoascus sp. VKM F-4520 (FW-2644)]|nr:hypothetical protein V502_04765 [Pseudogymnoascus sp. VKM F-4520 (FW-2644)]